MMDNQDLIKKVSYIKGLADGIKLSDKSDEGRLISQLIDVVDQIVDGLASVDVRVDELHEEVNELDESLCVVSDDVDDLYSLYEDEDEDMSFDDSDDYDEYDDMDYDDDEEDEDSELFELECPNCGEDVMIHFYMLDEESTIICPNCHKKIELEIDYDCDCGCHDHNHDDEDEE